MNSFVSNIIEEYLLTFSDFLDSVGKKLNAFFYFNHMKLNFLI